MPNMVTTVCTSVRAVVKWNLKTLNTAGRRGGERGRREGGGGGGCQQHGGGWRQAARRRFQSGVLIAGKQERGVPARGAAPIAFERAARCHSHQALARLLYSQTRWLKPIPR